MDKDKRELEINKCFKYYLKWLVAVFIILVILDKILRD